MFADNLVESRSNRLEARRVAVLPLVAGAHAALAAALVLASVWSLQYVTEPPIIIIPHIPVKLMPPPGGGGPKQDTQTERPKPDRSAVVPPIVIPETDPVIYDAEPGNDSRGVGVEGSIDVDDWGDGMGTGGGDLPGDFDVPKPPEPDRGPLAIGGDVRAPVRLVPLVPVYPETARKAGRQGTVVLRLIIDREGRVTDVEVIGGLPFGLTQAAVEAARNLRFKPAFRASTGQAVDCFFDLSVEFRIN